MNGRIICDRCWANPARECHEPACDRRHVTTDLELAMPQLIDPVSGELR